MTPHPSEKPLIPEAMREEFERLMDDPETDHLVLQALNDLRQALLIAEARLEYGGCPFCRTSNPTLDRTAYYAACAVHKKYCERFHAGEIR